MLIVIIVHVEYFSFFSLFVWERIGLISSAEGFVTLSGIVLGIVYEKRIHRDGFKRSLINLWKRSFQLYRVNIFVILSIYLLGKIPFIDIFHVSHWVPIFEPETAYPLYPPKGTSWVEIIKQTLLLNIGPHQFQVIGLYVGLIAAAPLVLYCLYRKKTAWLLAASLAIFVLNQVFHFQITAARFEWGFPTLTWQLIFVIGMVTGYHQDIVLGYIINKKNKPLFVVALCFSFVFLLIALNNPNAVFWPWRDLAALDGEFFHTMYMAWFQKPTLGLGRIINNISLFIVFYYILNRYWLPINKAIGWLLIPLGQASLYVFIVHVYFVLLFSNTGLQNYNSFWVNTIVHAATILLIWAMVKKEFLFQVIPR